MQRQLRTIAVNYSLHLRRTMAIFGVLAALCLFLYGFFLLEAVAHTASRTQAQSKIQNYTSKLSNLEQDYLSQTREMTLDRAHELGLVTPKEISTVYINDPARALSLRNR